MATNERAAGDVRPEAQQPATWQQTPALGAWDDADEQRARRSFDEINARTARLPFEREALSATMDELRGMGWRSAIDANGAIGGVRLA